MFWLICLISLTVIPSVRSNSHCPTNVTCIEKETCCQTSTGLWGCCPMEDGICCDDGIHCCPSNSICLPNGNCSFNSSTIHSFKGFSLKLKSVQCPDGSSCPDQNTCCQLSSGKYGCCPIVDAVCCSDHIHCCPANHQCDVERGRCKRKFSINMIGDVPCPGGSSSCPDGETCCKLQSGDYGCCPLNDAVCCDDHIHCCPHGSRCDTEHGQCLGEISIPWLKKKPSIHHHQSWRKIEMIEEDRRDSQMKIIDQSQSLDIIQCPDEVSYCPEETTCCQLKNGVYGCCPYEQGICCSDKIHCCPNGYSCDQSGDRCTKHLNGWNERQSRKIQEKKRKEKSWKLIRNEDHLCPDQLTKCLINQTCCPNGNSNPQTYSCCPYSKGVCCGMNGSLCCPNNYQCDEKQLSCQLQDQFRIESRIYDPSSNMNQCSSSNVICSMDQTCCPTYGTINEDFACCPFPNGQCCEDGKSCCPQKTICDIHSGGCIRMD